MYKTIPLLQSLKLMTRVLPPRKYSHLVRGRAVLDDPVPHNTFCFRGRPGKEKKMAELLLDPDIRKWVILPIVLITLMFGLLRHYITILLTNDNKKPKEEEVRDS